MDSCLLQKAMTWAQKLISVIDWGTRFPALLFLDRKIRWISLLLDPTSARLQLGCCQPSTQLQLSLREQKQVFKSVLTTAKPVRVLATFRAQKGMIVSRSALQPVTWLCYLAVGWLREMKWP